MSFGDVASGLGQAMRRVDKDNVRIAVDIEDASGVTINASMGQADDSAFTPGTTVVSPVGGVFDDTTPDSVDEGDVGGLRMSARRELYSQIRDAAGNERGVNVDASNQMAVVDSAVKTAVEIMDDWDESDRAKVNPIVGQAGVAGGAGAVGATVQRMTLASDDPAVTALQIMDDWDNGASDGASVSGDVAHDSADAGEPVKMGFKAYANDGTAPGTSVAEGDRANAISDLDGIQYVHTGHPFHFDVSADYGAAQTNTSVKAAPGAGLKIYITDLVISNGATAGNVTLLDGSGGTVKFECYPGVNGGVAHSFKNPIALTANTALCITSTTVTTHSINVCGYIGP